ncbi:MAG: DUF2207 domain-containing protein [Woeseiaceae bacterium]|nr:DUF2207 domain-containing protein [Woeseiaceae bacterium]
MIRSALLLLLSFAAHADERILSFHSDIVIKADASIEVTEVIRVRAEGKQIRRGIYRTIPTEYVDNAGNRHRVSIVPLSVLRDDRDEAFHVKTPRDQITVYFGRSDRYLETGDYEYRFRYRADRMLGFFETHDELYWNVTGFYWRFPIDRASASVSFDFDVSESDLVVDAYTGAFGQRGKDYSASVDDGPIVKFASNSPLSPVNGLTIAVAWPKGLVDEPGDLQRAMWFLNDNRSVLTALAGLIVLLAYYIPVWRKFGRDPAEGPVVTRYEPPHGYSPASLRYINQMYYDGKVMTAAIVNLAVKGYLEIEQDGKSHFLRKTDPGQDAPPMAAGEKELYEGLFESATRIELDNKNHKVIGAARSAHKQSLKDDYNGRYFNTNGMLNLPAVVIVIAFTVLSFAQGQEPTVASIGTLITMYVVMVLFAIYMKRPTMRGRTLLDQLSGFRDYLDVAEKEELNLRNPPDKTPQLFERYLPYALALGVDQRWAEKFATVLAAIRDNSGNAYQPAWYHGNWRGISSMSSDLSGSFSTAVGHSASAPGSSSGSGGGGFSGGGGGGGGGGGW